MIRKISIILVVTLVIFSSCVSRRSKLDSRNLIPEKDLVPILTEIYLEDSMLGIPRINLKYSPLDSLATYYYIVEKHGYTKEMMDKTMKYYFIRKPKKLIQMYDKVLGILSEMESRNKRIITLSISKSGTLWTGSELYNYPDPEGSDSTTFEIHQNRPGKYTLYASVTVFPDDLSCNPCLTAYTCNPDSMDTGKRTYSTPVRYIKDGYPHRYLMTFVSSSKDSLIIRGNLFEPENHPGEWEKHFRIENLSVLYSVYAL
jgi:hypothetical protein